MLAAGLMVVVISLIELACAASSTSAGPTYSPPSAASPPTTEIAPGVLMPVVNLGTCCGSEATRSFPLWWGDGGRGVDTALDYGKECPGGTQAELGAAIRAAGAPRADVFITTKIRAGFDIAHGGPLCLGVSSDYALSQVRQDLRELNVSQVDLVLLHSPCLSASANFKLWQGLEEALAQNLTRAIGVSNYSKKQLAALLAQAGLKVKPAVNQCELSVAHHVDEDMAFCRANNITYEAYEAMRGCPFGNAQVRSIAAAHSVGVSQVCLRWVLQKGAVLAVGIGSNATTMPAYARGNLDLFGFALNASEMAFLDALHPPAAFVARANPNGAAKATAHHDAPPPTTMRRVAAGLGCKKPFNNGCVKVSSVATPSAKTGQALVAVEGTSVNPSDVDAVEMGGCLFGCGNDVAGTVLACPGCTRLKAGDKVWGFASPSYADYVTGPEKQLGLRPQSLAAAVAGTVPEVGLTSLFSLKRTASLPNTPMPAGTPWGARGDNVTVVITAGSGGTGYIGIEIAKAYGAAHIATAASGANEIAFVKSLGATHVVDYKVEDLFASLANNSVDYVYDNYAAEGTADKAMRVLRPGGTYLMMPHGECYVSRAQAPPCLSAHPKPGVRQVNYVTGPDYKAYGLQGLQELATLFEEGRLHAHVARTFRLGDIAAAFNFSAGGGEGGVNDNHFGKIAIVP